MRTQFKVLKYIRIKARKDFSSLTYENFILTKSKKFFEILIENMTS
jgi:hypothetical protein